MAFTRENTIALDIGTKTIKLVKIAEQVQETVFVENSLLIPTPVESFISTFMEKPITSPNVLQNAIKDGVKSFGSKIVNCIVTIPDPLAVVNWLSVPAEAKEDLYSTIRLKLEPMLPNEIDRWSIAHMTLSEKENINILTQAVLMSTVLGIGGIVQGAGLIPVMIDSTFFNTCNLIENYLNLEENAKNNIAVLSIGNESSSVSVFKNGEPKILRHIGVGGKQFNKSLMKELSIEDEEADEMKKNDVFFLAESLQEQNKVKNYNIIKPVFGELIRELYNSFDSYLAKFREFKIHEMVVTGGCSCFKNMMTAIEYHLNIPVKSITKIVDVRNDVGPIPDDDLYTFSSAIGSLCRDLY